MIPDPGVPVRDLLLGPDAARLLDALVSEAAGKCLAAEVTQVRYLPEVSITVQYAAKLRWGEGPETTETMVASSGGKLPEDVATLEVDGSPVAFWRYPNDPFLPGLSIAANPDDVRRILEQLEAPSDSIAIRSRGYRPGRRAVLEVESSGTRIFIKFVRPSRVPRLQETHRELAGSLPVPHSYGWSRSLGLVVLQALPGQTLRSAVASGSHRLPTGRLLAELVWSLPELSSEARNVRSTLERAADHGRLLSYVAPSLGSRLSTLLESLQGGERALSTVHGDFHTSQVITADESIVGLIDVDTAGIGERIDDLATMAAQISTLSLGPSGQSFTRYGGDVVADFDRVVDPIELRRRVAAAVLGFATGPFRVQQTQWRRETEKRVALAEQWLDSARL